MHLNDREPRSARSWITWRWVTVLGIFVWLHCGAPHNHEPPTRLMESLLIAEVSIVDPIAGVTSEPRDILIARGRIVEIADGGTIAKERAERSIAARGLFAMPGLIDVHAHIGDGGIGNQSEADRQMAMAQFVRYGVTTIFVPGGGGGNDDQLAAWKKRHALGELSPGVYGSGAIITAPGSHPIGTLWNMPVGVDPVLVYERGAAAIAQNEPVDPLLDWKHAKGVDAIKIVIEDGPGPWYPKPRLSKSKISELVRAAHRRELRVFAHVSMTAHVADGVAAGVDGIMHSAEDRMPDSLLDEMARGGVFYVPTLALYDGFFRQALGQFEEEPFALAGVSKRAIASLDTPEWRNQPADPIDWVEPTRQALAHNLRRCMERGVPLALGTDVNNPTVFPGYSAHEELALMVAAGLSPARALQAATEGGASFLKRESDLGKIEKGFEADVLLLHENPLLDILNTRTLHTVILDGKVIEDVVTTVKSE